MGTIKDVEGLGVGRKGNRQRHGTRRTIIEYYRLALSRASAQRTPSRTVSSLFPCPSAGGIAVVLLLFLAL